MQLKCHSTLAPLFYLPRISPVMLFPRVQQRSRPSVIGLSLVASTTLPPWLISAVLCPPYFPMHTSPTSRHQPCACHLVTCLISCPSTLCNRQPGSPTSIVSTPPISKLPAPTHFPAPAAIPRTPSLCFFSRSMSCWFLREEYLDIILRRSLAHPRTHAPTTSHPPGIL